MHSTHPSPHVSGDLPLDTEKDQLASLETSGGDLLTTFQSLVRRILALDDIHAVFGPLHQPLPAVVMPTLITDPDRLAGFDPLAPAFSLNAARMLSRLTRRPSRGRIAAVLRPCEIRAFVELVKLKQGRLEDVIIIGMDCLGAYTNRDYNGYAPSAGEKGTRQFYQRRLSGGGGAGDRPDLAPSCAACTSPLPAGADLAVWLYGVDVDNQLLVQSQSDKGREVLGCLELGAGQFPSRREAVVTALLEERRRTREQWLEETEAAVSSMEKLAEYLARCVNCYNCRVACPVCYCRECVFATDVFDYEPLHYLDWARRNGVQKMPSDTVFYHLTRLAHISTACVGCGQCSNACPNDVNVAALCQAVARRTQAAFGYRPGYEVEEKPPLSTFVEGEFGEVVGID